MKISDIYNKHSEDFTDMEDWCSEQYEQYFSDYFKIQSFLYKKWIRDSSKFTEEELEWIMTDLPLELCEVAEVLNKYRLKRDSIKLQIKSVRNISTNSSEDSTDIDKSDTFYDSLLMIALDSVITRVENQISSSRELIMGAKKIWDRRKSNVTPVQEVVPESENTELPDYTEGMK